LSFSKMTRWLIKSRFWGKIQSVCGGALAVDSALLFDLGGTHLRCACLTGKDEIRNTTRQGIRSFRDGSSSAEIWSEIIGKIAAYAINCDRLVEKSAPLVISFPGPLHEDGTMVNAPTVSGLDSKLPDLREELTRKSGRRVHILNDVSAAALYLARDSEWGRFMVVTVSSGIGSKVCFRHSSKVVLFDKGPYAGEIGHLTVDQSRDAPVCDCGGKGHLGGIASGRGIERLGRQQAAADPRAFSRSLCREQFGATAETLNNEEHLVPAVRAGDQWSLRVLQEGTRPLAVVLNTVFLALGLQGILVIGGFASSIGETYLELLRKMMRNRCDYPPLSFSPDMVRFGNMCDEACLRGAAEFALMARKGRL
jgi:predicted NBD/HSP70 family sugar kinase